MSNPYTLQPVTKPEFFAPRRGGRGSLAHRLLQNLCRTDPSPDCISILGERRFGKTSLLGYLQQRTTDVPDLQVAGMNMLALSPQDPDGFYAALTRALIRSGALPTSRPTLTYVEFEEFLRELRRANKRLLLFIDEFDLVAREQRFPLTFFNQLRAAANDLPLTFVLASVKRLAEIAHSGVYTSPFFNIFHSERLELLSQKEAEALVASPPGGQAGFADRTAEILALAGRHPYFLQMACHIAWDLREEEAGTLDLHQLRARFTSRAQDQYQYIWDHSDDKEKKALCALAGGKRSGTAGLPQLIERGYATTTGSLDSCGECFTAFVRDQCASLDPPCPPRTGKPVQPGVLPPVTTSSVAPVLRLALIVGVNQYKHQQAGRHFLAPLRYAEPDAHALAEFLDKEMGFAVTLLTGAQADCAAVLAAFKWLKDTTTADPHQKSCFVFHFSGHGCLDPASEDTAHLMLYDSDPHDPTTAGLEMSELVYRLVPQVRVPNTLVLLDACHAGYAAGVRDIDVEPANQLTNVMRQFISSLRGRMILAACAGEAQAREESSLGHGVFTHYVLKHWRDLDCAPPTRRITFASLVDYVGSMMQQNHPQVPSPVFNCVGEGATFTLRCEPGAGAR